jgi:hypothetical protein
MAEREPQSEPALKVSDRRHFTESGDRRPEVEAAEFEESPARPAGGPEGARSGAKPAEAAKAPPPPPPPPEPAAPPGASLAPLIEQLYMSGLMLLGAEVQPGQRGQVDLEGARETIELLGALQQKTKGNLDPGEERLLSGALYELRLGFTEVQRASQRVATLPPPPGARRR